MDDSVDSAINDQINNELASAYFYLSAAAYFGLVNLDGFAHWMRIQAREELGHAVRFFDFLVDRGTRVSLEAVARPKADFTSPLNAFEEVLANERTVTRQINDLYRLTLEHADYPAQILLQWFVQEQVEEEKSAHGVVGRLTLAGDNAGAVLLIDQELAARPAEPDGPA